MKQFHRDELTVLPKENGGERSERGEKGKGRSGEKNNASQKPAGDRNTERKSEDKKPEPPVADPATEAVFADKPASEE